MNGRNLLIADDNRNVLNALSLLLSSEFDSVKTLQHPNRLLEELSAREYDVVLLDMNFTAGHQTGNEGIYWLREIKASFSRVEVVMFTAYADVELAVKALKEGATDFVVKPWDNDKLLATLQAASRIARSKREISVLKTRERGARQQLNKGGEIIYRSPAMSKILDMVGKVAPTDANILITGENGTGKELIAREIHRHSLRSDGFFVLTDLSALTESLFESELFGHKKGAFTGAEEDREGKFLLANGGTLFLDEIGNIPLHLQAKLLTVLQTRQISPVGSNRMIPLDIRIISATNQPIDQLAGTGKFREDLLYRINTIRLHLPALRERTEDIPVLAAHFIDHYSRKYHKPPFRLDTGLTERLQRMPWPGNIRELQHTMEKMVILSENGKPDFSSLNDAEPKFTSALDEPLTLEEMEEKVIRATLARSGNNLTAAASSLGISRPTLYGKIKKYGIQ
ncbi:MAG: sigma-54-dependent transcriptional regulator [Bacteroidales bacterium]